jgi:translation elongation factor EF-G
MVFVINKIDRLIIEMKLPPNDSYLKLKYIINEINKIMEDSPYKLKKPEKFSPELGKEIQIK